MISRKTNQGRNIGRMAPPVASPPTAAAAAPPAAGSTAESPTALPAAPSTPSVIAAAVLPHDLSPWGMFLNADIVVKVVMVGLVFASLVTWTVWLAKNLELWTATRSGRAALAVLNEARSLSEAQRSARPTARRWRGCCEPRSTKCRFRRIPTRKP